MKSDFNQTIVCNLEQDCIKGSCFLPRCEDFNFSNCQVKKTSAELEIEMEKCKNLRNCRNGKRK